ncbi:hypothetical protein J6590_021639 [Homalodisca vitripennis]|nr:hypothetical protein J6590_021639 [Homalodisca vitripennis]
MKIGFRFNLCLYKLAITAELYSYKKYKKRFSNVGIACTGSVAGMAILSARLAALPLNIEHSIRICFDPLNNAFTLSADRLQHPSANLN